MNATFLFHEVLVHAAAAAAAASTAQEEETRAAKACASLRPSDQTWVDY